MSVTRYEFELYHCNGGEMLVSDTGDYVSYDDYAALEARCAALAAENAGLKEEISNITFMRDDDFFGSTQRAQEVMGRLVNIKTPATDAFLAEVRAQGVEMAVDVVKHCYDNICAGGLQENREYEESIVQPHLDGIDDELKEIIAQLRKGVQS